MIGQKFGRYTILSEIGRGGMAQVYLADDPGFRRKVAVKVLPPQFLENSILRTRFDREARTIATLEHPAIVPVYDYGEQDDQLYLVMRFMPGGSLYPRMRQGPIPLEEVHRILAQLAPALDAVHRQGIVHRDLKPGNILFDGFGNPALSDFGIAQLSEATVELTGSAVIGTPAYMSPEQVRAEPGIDGRSDIYALGVILYEMLTGRQPYRSATPMGIALMHLSEPVPRIRAARGDLPLEMEAIVQKALAKKREERYASAQALTRALQKVKDLPKGPADEGLEAGPDAGLNATEQDGAFTALSPGLQNRAEAAQRKLAADPGAPASSPEQPRSPGQALPSSERVAAKSNLTRGRESPSPERGSTAGMARRAGLFVWGIGGAAGAIGLCLLLMLGGMIIRFGVMPAMRPAATTASPATETPPADPRAILFSDDFTQPGNGWPKGQKGGGEYSYVEGGYRILVSQADALLWASPETSFEDVSVSVGATKVSGSDGNYYGLVCREEDPDHFYYFVIWGDGHYTIGKHKDGVFSALIQGGWSTSDLIRKGNDANQLRADCSGQTLSLYVNGAKVDQVEDSEFTSGKAGVAAAALDDQGMEVVFDHFVVREAGK